MHKYKTHILLPYKLLFVRNRYYLKKTHVYLPDGFGLAFAYIAAEDRFNHNLQSICDSWEL